MGLYLNPPHHALVLCVDEKSQIQALSAASRSFRCYQARWSDAPRLQTHGTTSLFAALDIATG